ncbi:hypothetical protein AB4Z18_00395 [Leifsonia sp. 2TAF2]|uniref:hypothetical protein n=1 Tax=Leifsonia sp. 2TAF2 TaxID=3233009 RepID=UPI003F97607E
MKLLKPILAAFILALGLSFGAGAPANAAGAAPSNAHVSLYKSYAVVGWSAAPGATSYKVIVSKDGYSGPYQGYTTTSTSIQLSYANFPYRDGSGKAYRFSIQAIGGGWTSTATTDLKVFYDGTRGAVSTSNKNAAGQKVADCIHQGSAAGLITGAGAGAVALATVWIPGVDAVTAGGAAIAIAGAAAGTFIVCIIN